MISNPKVEPEGARTGGVKEAKRVEPRPSEVFGAGMVLLGLAGLTLLLDQLSDPAVLQADVAARWGASLLVLAIMLWYAWRDPERPPNAAVARLKTVWVFGRLKKPARADSGQKTARVLARQETAVAFVSVAVSVLVFVLGLIVTRANDSERIALLVAVTIFALCGAVVGRAVVGRAVAARRQRIIENAILHEVNQRIAAHTDAVDRRIAELSARLAAGCESDTDRHAPPVPRRRRGLRWAALAVLRR